MISAAQIRAARALLGISAAALAKISGVDLRTIQRFESIVGVPKSRSGTLQRIKDTLEAAGITFVGDPETSPGVQLQHSSPTLSRRTVNNPG
jgi:transcriptional regulator with XRE-family HTH domain